MINFLSKKIKIKKIYHQSVFDKINTKHKFKAMTSLRFFDHFNIFDQDKIIKNINPYIEKNGFLIMTALNKNSLESLLSKFFPYGRYNYFYNKSLYLEMFSAHGFKVNSIKPAFFFPRGSFLYFQKIPLLVNSMILLDKILTKLFPGFAALHIFVLEK
jgi:hypothetical protein